VVPKVFKEKGSDIYQFRMRYPDGKRHQKSTGLTHEGKAQKVAKEAYEAAQMRRRGKEPELPLAELVQLWCEKHAPPRKSPAYVAAMESFGRLHLGDLAGLLPSTLTTPLVEDALLAYMKDHAMSSANQWLAYLRVVCHWAVSRDMNQFIPWKVKKTKIQKVPKLQLPVRKTSPFLEMVDQLTQAQPSLALAIRIMLGLGLRGGEARDAQWEWFNAERRTYTPGKTKGLEAVARPVPDWMMAILEPLAQVEGPMVPTVDGRRLTPGQIQEVMDAACKAVGIPRLTGHRLRGTYATLLADMGVPIQDIMYFLGQKDVRTTLVYLEVDMSRVIGAQARIAEKTGLSGRKTGGQQAPEPHQP
jgi:integrase